MKRNVKRGVPIGAYISQPLGNFGLTRIDHHMKEVMRAKGYFRYSDDSNGFGRTKGETKRHMREFIHLTELETGLVVKANVVLAPLSDENDDKPMKRRRKRQRGKKRKIS